MLCELMVDGLGVIDRAELGLCGGLIALTGETGAGKTLIVAALGLLLGDRADRSLVRSGCERALVEGRFVLPDDHPAVVRLTEAGYLDSPAEVVISREVFRDDRPARARLNGRMATVAMLSEIGSLLVDVAGQHEHQRLADAGARRELLDTFAGARATELSSRVRLLVRAASAAAARVTEVREGLGNRERELDVLRFEVGEIVAVDVRPGEIDSLRREAQIQEGAEALGKALDRAGANLVGDGAAQDLIASAASQLEEVRTIDDSIDQLIARLNEAVVEIGDVGSELAKHAPTTEGGSIDSLRTRLDAIARVARKYGTDATATSVEESIISYKERAEQRIAELDSIDDRIEAAEAEAVHARATAMETAKELAALRKKAQPKLDAAVEELLARLAMQGARFSTELEARELFEGGLETVDFLVAANPGDELRPIGRVASGGELSRIALALHVATSTSHAPTVVFDEVDAGVGGRAAQSVGRALVDLALATGSQVIVVTHLPQVAAFADAHLRVNKTKAGATVDTVEGVERVEELSRMLAGLPESDRARQHAEELLLLASEATGR